MPQVLSCFKVGKSEEKDFMYTGFRLRQTEEGVKIDQDKYVAARLKKTSVSIMVSNLDDMKDCEVIVYTDAAFRNLNENTDSCGSYVILVVNKRNGTCSPVEWKSGKFKWKVHSTLGAETQALYN